MSLATATASTASARLSTASLKDNSAHERTAPLGSADIFAPAAPIEFTLITSRNAFDALEDEWNALFARAATSAQVFQTFNWNWHWANHYLSGAPGGIGGINLCVLAGHRNGKLVMVWPLVRERVRGIAQIFWMGEPVSQYGDVLIDDIPDTLPALKNAWNYLRKHAHADVMRLRRVREDARVAPLLRVIGASASNPQTAPYLDLASAENFAAYEQRYTSKARRNRRRFMRRLEEQGNVRFARIHGGAEARTMAERAIDMKTAWLASRGLFSQALADKRVRGFFADVAESASHPTGCVVSRLTSNDDIAALDVSFACKGRLAVHMIVFNLAYEKAGVGGLLMEHCISDAFDEDIATFDLLAPGDAYKLEWADSTIGTNDWSQALSLKGSAYVEIYLNRLRGQIKSTLEAVPKSLRKRLNSLLP
ncbi:MAG: GNAT family N-acetyltransferase [Hyphomicrobium sp.]